MARTQIRDVMAENKIMHSYVIGIHDGQLFKGLPPTLCGYAIPAIHSSSVKPPIAPQDPPIKTASETLFLLNPIASAKPSTGMGAYASIRRYPWAYASSQAAINSSGLSNSAMAP